MGATSVVAAQDGTTVTLSVTISGQTGSPTIVVSGLPSGMNYTYTTSAGGPSGNLVFTGSTNAAAGTYTAQVAATVNSISATQNVTVISAPVAVVSNQQDTTLGINGVMQQFMSTSFQIGSWTTDYFNSGTGITAKEATLTALGAQHQRVQVVASALPMLSNTGTAADWSFTQTDMILQPVLAVGDHSPELQIANAPAWMCKSDGTTLDVANHAQDFAAMMAKIVKYYNKGGFTVGSTHFQSASSYPITWWGVFNEFNINGLTAKEYIQLYNTVVPAMLAVDPTIKLSAIELSDWGLNTGDNGDPAVMLAPFLQSAASGGVNTQVDVLSTHFYGTCNQSDSDTTLMNNVAVFAQNIEYFRQQLAKRSDLQSAQVWVTENNVNADFSNSNGMSTCNPSQKFVLDTRGTSAFFAAWRPYLFSQLGKAGNQALYQWNYYGDHQYAEVDENGTPYLSYWVDKTLAAAYPSTTSNPGPKILKLSATESNDVETLATEDSTGAVTVMIANHAIHAAADNNGSGDARTVIVDASGLGTFSSASLTTLDGSTSSTTGPTASSVTPSSRMTVTLTGYGTALLKLNP